MLRENTVQHTFVYSSNMSLDVHGNILDQQALSLDWDYSSNSTVKTVRTATAATEWQHCCLETFHGSGAVILEASRWAPTGRGLDPRTLGDSQQQLEQQRVAAQHTTTATTRKRNKLNNKVRRKRAWSQLYSVGDSLQQGWQRHMR